MSRLWLERLAQLLILIGERFFQPRLANKIRATVRFGDTEIQFKLNGDIDFMFIVQADNPAVGYSISFVVTDSEGNVVPTPPVTVEVTSTDTAVVAVDTAAAQISFGSPGVASINVAVKDADGTLLGSFGAQFTVTVGDPSTIVGGTIAFEGLTEV
jgi:hypothetical protein